MRRKNMTTLHLRKSSGRSPLRLAFILIPLALFWFALSPMAPCGIPAPDVGNVTGRVVTGLNSDTTYSYRVCPYTATVLGSYSEGMSDTTVPTTGLIIHATFDSSITGNPNAAAIEAMINRAISIYESLFSDPVTIQIRFRYATPAPNGTPLPAGPISQSNFVLYMIPSNTP